MSVALEHNAAEKQGLQKVEIGSKENSRELQFVENKLAFSNQIVLQAFHFAWRPLHRRNGTTFRRKVGNIFVNFVICELSVVLSILPANIKWNIDGTCSCF